MTTKPVTADDIHPMRWRKTWRSSNEIARLMSRVVGGGSHSLESSRNSFDAVRAYFETDRQAALSAEQMQQHGELIIESYMRSAMMIGLHLNAGDNIFRLSDGLAEALRETDLDGIRAGDLAFPYNRFYLSLNEQIAGGLPGSDNVIDGAYIVVDRHGPQAYDLTIHLTTRPLDPTDIVAAMKDPSFDLHLRIKSHDHLISDTMEAAIAGGEDTMSMAQAVENERAHSLTGEALARFHQRTSERDAAREASIPAMRRALAAVVAAVAFLSSDDDETSGPPTWPDDAPRDVVALAEHPTKPKARRNGRARLLERGFTQIRILGPHVPTLDDFKRMDGESGSVRPHWRRGHFTHQAHGPARSLRKIRWIRPLIVRHDLGEPEVGHVYTMGP